MAVGRNTRVFLLKHHPVGGGRSRFTATISLDCLINWPYATPKPDKGCEVRLRRFDGAFQWFLLRHEPLRDSSGAVVRWYGTWINIEDSKQKELLGVAGKAGA